MHPRLVEERKLGSPMLTSHDAVIHCSSTDLKGVEVVLL